MTGGAESGDLVAALVRSRTVMLHAATTPEARRLVGPIVAEIDRSIATLEPSVIAAAPLTPLEDTLPPASHLPEAIEREKERRQALDNPTRVLDAVMRNSQHGIIVCDVSGQLTLHNVAAERIWAGSATTSSIEDWRKYRAYHPDGRPYEADDWAMARSLRHGEVTTNEAVHFQRFDGTHGLLLGSAAPIVGEDGAIEGAIAAFADITPRSGARALPEGRPEDDPGRAFVTPVSPELQTCLRTILGWTRVLRKGNLDEGQRARALEAIENNAARQNEAIEDLFDVACVMAEAMDPQPVDISAVTEAALDSVRAAAEARAVALCAWVDELPAIQGDARRLRYALRQLFANAIKLAREGGLLEVRVTAAQGRVEIAIADDGVGTPAELVPAVFDPFRQGDTRPVRADGDLDLGLAFVRHVVALHGGSVDVRAGGAGPGPRFTVHLPLARPPR